MIQMKCPACGHQLQISDEYAGTNGRCRHCGGAVMVPNPAPARPAEEPVTGCNEAGAIPVVQASQIVSVARFGQRIASDAIDLCILIVVAWFISTQLKMQHQLLKDAVMSSVLPEYQGLALFGGKSLMLLGTVLFLALPYFVFFEGSPIRATPGKIALRMTIQKRSGAKPSILRTLLRNALKPFSVMFLGLGVLMIAVTKRKQAFHDMVSGTVVAMAEPKLFRQHLYPGLATGVLAFGSVVLLIYVGNISSPPMEVARVKLMTFGDLFDEIPELRTELFREAFVQASPDLDLMSTVLLPHMASAEAWADEYSEELKGLQPYPREISNENRALQAVSQAVAEAIRASEEEFRHTTFANAINAIAKDEVQWGTADVPASDNFHSTHVIVYSSFKLEDSTPVRLQFLVEREGRYILPYTSHVGNEKVESDDTFTLVGAMAAGAVWAPHARRYLEARKKLGYGLEVGRVYTLTGYLYAGIDPSVYSTIVRLQTGPDADHSFDTLQSLVALEEAIYLTPGTVVNLVNDLPFSAYPDLCSVALEDATDVYYLNKAWFAQSVEK